VLSPAGKARNELGAAVGELGEECRRRVRRLGRSVARVRVRHGRRAGATLAVWSDRRSTRVGLRSIGTET
jgi:hypothetical protein